MANAIMINDGKTMISLYQVSSIVVYSWRTLIFSMTNGNRIEYDLETNNPEAFQKAKGLYDSEEPIREVLRDFFKMMG